MWVGAQKINQDLLGVSDVGTQSVLAHLSFLVVSTQTDRAVGLNVRQTTLKRFHRVPEGVTGNKNTHQFRTQHDKFKTSIIMLAFLNQFKSSN